MFCRNGEPTRVSKAVTEVLRLSEFFKEGTKSSIACVVYRYDRIHEYFFLTAHAGLCQIEPMFGPLVAGDLRQKGQPSRRPAPATALGFARREGIKEYRKYPTDLEGVENRKWQVWYSARTDDGLDQFHNFETNVLPALANILDTTADDEPLFAELWRLEYVAREQLHKALLQLPANVGLEEVGQALTTQVQQILSQIQHFSSPRPIDDILHVGIYLDTGYEWALFSSAPGGSVFPSTVTSGYDLANLPENRLDELEKENVELSAFAWVHRSTRPVLLNLASGKLSDAWSQRFRLAPGVRFSETFDGCCIAPLLDLNNWARAKGLVVLASAPANCLNPAHAFLLSQIAKSLSEHLIPRFPLPGFPWWPSLSRGGGLRVPLSWRDEPSLAEDAKESVTRIVSSISPTGGSADVQPQESGKSGANVYRLTIRDQFNRAEIPRILKIGREGDITTELRKYYAFVHNKRIGATCRVDAAMVTNDSDPDRRLAAIVYTVVGAGDGEMQWSQWARYASRVAIEAGLRDLRRQLKSWYEVTAPPMPLHTKPLISGRLERLKVKSSEMNHAECSDPSYEQILTCLKQIEDKHENVIRGAPTCVAHGDLHCRNIFTLYEDDSIHQGTGKDTNLRRVHVAVIDWGEVESGRHPLTDVALLAADLVFKVRYGEKMNDGEDKLDANWAIETLRNWETTLLDKPELQARLAIVDQLAKMLTWGSKEVPYLDGGARRSAWKLMQNVADGVDPGP